MDESIEILKWCRHFGSMTWKKASRCRAFDYSFLRTQKTLKGKQPRYFECAQIIRNALRVGAICGLVAPFVTYTCILLAIASYPEFNWVYNALSDLGIVPGVTMVLFNWGLIVGGFLLLIFATVLVMFTGKDIVGRVGASVLVMACIALISVGIFNEHFKPTHYLFSVALFVLLPISLLILAGAFWRGGDKRFSVFSLAIGFAAAAPWVLQFVVNYVSHVAIPEFVSGLAGAIWVLTLSYNMLKESRSKKG